MSSDFSDRLNWPYESQFFQVCRQTVPHTGSSNCKGPVSETAVRPVYRER